MDGDLDSLDGYVDADRAGQEALSSACLAGAYTCIDGPAGEASTAKGLPWLTQQAGKGAFSLVTVAARRPPL